MSEIIFKTKGYKVPIVLEVEVDGESVTYKMIDGGIRFAVWISDTKRALSIVNEIISQIKAERDDPKHGVSWRTISVEVTAESAWYVCVDWKYYARDAG